jgi:hypothetical protein
MAGLDLDKIRERLSLAVEGFEHAQARVGWFPTAVYEQTGESVASIAVKNEFGDPGAHIPPRPFMRPTVNEQRDAWAKIIQDGARQVVKGNIQATDVLDAVGNQAAGDIKKKISSIWSPELSERTVAARAAKYKSGKITESLRKPLEDSGYMKTTCTSDVVRDE